MIMVISSFKFEKDIFTRVPVIFFEPNFGNYATVFRIEMFTQGLGNSILVTAFAILMTLAFALPTAYAYSRFAKRGVRRTAVGLIALRMFPPIIIAIPLYPIFMQLGLVDNPLVLIIINTAFQLSMTTLLLKVYLDAISSELDDAAMIDGCSRPQAFFRILLPIMRPGLIASAIFVALSSWNDYLFAYLFTNYKARTLPVAISEILSNVESHAYPEFTWSVAFAACTLQMLPVLIFIWYIQKTLLSGFTFGGIKG
jgi:multiple sugar transport system permease protein